MFLLGAWCSGITDKKQYLQIDLGVPKIVTKVAIQGRPQESDYVSSFAVFYSNDTVQFTDTFKVRCACRYLLNRAPLCLLFAIFQRESHPDPLKSLMTRVKLRCHGHCTRRYGSLKKDVILGMTGERRREGHARKWWFEAVTEES